MKRRYLSANKRLKFQKSQSDGGFMISPFKLGEIGGRMAQTMIQSAQNFLAQEAAREVGKSFHRAIDEQIKTSSPVPDDAERVRPVSYHHDHIKQ